MIVEYTRYKIDSERQGQFIADFENGAPSLIASEHCLTYELAQCTEDTSCFILRLEWDSKEGHLKGFRSSAEFKSFFAHVRPYVNDIEEMRHYQLSRVTGRKEHSIVK
jgi:quinol monooxygenase YgiN